LDCRGRRSTALLTCAGLNFFILIHNFQWMVAFEWQAPYMRLRWVIR
jgi:hypothetical protein